MLTLVEGSGCPEGNSRIAIDLKHAKLPHDVRRTDGKKWPRLLEDDKVVAEGIKPCLEAVEERRYGRVTQKAGMVPHRQMMIAG